MLLCACPPPAFPTAPAAIVALGVPLLCGWPLSATAGAAQTFVAGRDIPGQWWTLFRSEPLNGLVEQAFRANPNLRAAEAVDGPRTEDLVALSAAYDAAGDRDGAASAAAELKALSPATGAAPSRP